MKLVKKILKNILPYGIVQLIKNITINEQKDYLIYFANFGNSSLLNNFKIWSLLPTNKNVAVGDNCMLDCKILFESGSGNVIIGNSVYIGDSTLLCRSKIEIKDHVFIAWGCYIYDHDSHSLNYLDRIEDIDRQNSDYRNGLNFIQNKNWETVVSKPIKICSHAWIGMNVIILKGVTIGEGAIVAAGSVVTKDVAPWTIVAGNPALFVRNIK